MAALAAGVAPADELRTMGEVLAMAAEDDWQVVPAENLVLMTVGDADVAVELAPQFAPAHVENVRALLADSYFDGLAVIRSQDNYVAQWGDPAGTPIAPDAEPRAIGAAKAKVAGEFDRPARGIDVTELAASDAYADMVGFVDGFPVAGDGERVWLAHCYGMVGVGRGNEADSGNGTSLYVVTGHAPRHLDRNVTLIGRVLAGIEAFSALPRGTGQLGFYETAEATTPIASATLASELPEGERPAWQRLKTDTNTFDALVESRRTRHEDWFLDSVGRIGLCNVPLPARPAPTP